MSFALAYTLALVKRFEAMDEKDRGVTCGLTVTKHTVILRIFQPVDHIAQGVLKVVNLCGRKGDIIFLQL